MKEGKEISPVDLTLLKILRRGLQLALLAGRGLLFQVLQGERGTNQNHPSIPAMTPGRGSRGPMFVPEWLCFPKSSSPPRTDRPSWHFALSPRSLTKGCPCLKTDEHFFSGRSRLSFVARPVVLSKRRREQVVATETGSGADIHLMGAAAAIPPAG